MIKPDISVSIMRIEQLATILKYDVKKIYIPFDLFFWGLIGVEDVDNIHADNKQVYISMPRIIRKRDEEYLDSLKEFLLLGKADGILLKNIEEVGYINSLEESLKKEFISINGKIEGYTSLMIETDYELYNWNKSSLAFNKSFSSKQTVPMELSVHEIKELGDKELIYPVYGRAPLMVTANCVKKTTGNCMADCTHGSFEWRLNDRKNKQFLVYSSCIHCYNEIFNSVPTSLHRQVVDIIQAGFSDFRIDFTDEDNKLIDRILDYYIVSNRKGSFPVADYTTAHFNKGAI